MFIAVDKRLAEGMLATMSDVVANLNPAQLEAVQYGDGPLMVLAGAGSGKTRVITRRIAWLLEQGVGPRQILALTFTNKAAGEMVHRVQDLGGHRVQVATFHSACARFLRQDAEHLGFPRDFSIYDTYDRDVCIKQLLLAHGVKIGGPVTASKVGNRISHLKNFGMTADNLMVGHSEVDAAVKRIYGAYATRMRDLGAMDFDDLLLRFTDLLVEHPAIAQVYQDRFRYLLVDEFQDTNLVQYRLIKILAEKHRNVCVVGDPDQSIYKFRGAEIRNILEFEEDYEECEIIRLETNYRSTGCILTAAQGIIENNKGRMEKTLRTDADFGSPLTVARFGSELEEADELVRAIDELVRSGVDASEVAVFYRTHFLSRAIEQALRYRGLAYEIVGGLRFFERREIKDVLAYLRVVVNPLDDVSMHRIVNVPARGVGKASLGKLVDRAAEEEMSLFEAVCDDQVRTVVSSKARAGLERLAGVLTELRGDLAPDVAIRKVLEGTGYMQYACDLGDPQDVSREENLLELINDATTYSDENDDGLAGYLQHVSLLTSQDEVDADDPTITLMTVHSAKGLEFDHVFLPGLEEGIFPHSRSMDDPAEIEEERRLMYVAVTRARKTVAFSYAAFRMVAGITQRQDISRFTREIPEACVEWSGGVGYGSWTDQSNSYDDDAYESGAGSSDWETAEDAGSDSSEAGYQADAGDSEEGEVLRVGMHVIHPAFGHGEVRRISGEGFRAKVVVRFRDGREKTLVPEYSRLQVVSGGDSL